SLYVTADEGLSLLSIDGDALGDALEPICLDGIGEELTGLFPRIVTRYQHHGGDRAAMERFLLEHFGVTREAQEEARALLAGEEGMTATGPTSPPALVIA